VVVSLVMRQLDQMITDLDERISALEDEIQQVLAQGEWASSAALLQSISEIGMLTAAWLLVLTVNFSRCASAAALSNYVGLTPVSRESGTSARACSAGTHEQCAITHGRVSGNLERCATQSNHQGIL
jgi:transposase